MLKATIIFVGVAVLLCIIRDINSHPTLDIADAEGVLGEEEHGNRTKRSLGCTNSGCHRGHCWAYCGARPEAHQEWCWTTRGATWDLQYVGCTSDAQCDGCWSCAGACSL
ncbi:Allergen Tha p 2 [Folsomia candida]|uniref:Allergen Tha p 2 n=1 Tax=Folsomia candida TaxID=158441 RepID=A0A226F2M9_FOLCA|nr:Allergen Tha p 2 [Folsomia candida]